MLQSTFDLIQIHRIQKFISCFAKLVEHDVFLHDKTLDVLLCGNVAKFQPWYSWPFYILLIFRFQDISEYVDAFCSIIRLLTSRSQNHCNIAVATLVFLAAQPLALFEILISSPLFSVLLIVLYIVMFSVDFLFCVFRVRQIYECKWKYDLVLDLACVFWACANRMF